MVTSFETSEKGGPNRHYTTKRLPYNEYLVKIGPVDPEFFLLKVLFKKKEINASRK